MRWSEFFDGFLLWRRVRSHSDLMEILRVRVTFFCVIGLMLIFGVLYRLADVMVLREKWPDKIAVIKDTIVKKADIVDRNGNILASSIATASCYADPSVMIDAEDAAIKLSKIPELPSYSAIKQKIQDKNKHFVWITRHVTPKLQEKIMDLGIPGINFQKDYKRIYIYGNLFSHVIGCSDIDGNGVSGIEKRFNDQLIKSNALEKKLVMSLDLRIQSIIHEELQKSVKEFKAIGGNAILMSTTGEILAMVSFPDFDPNDVAKTTILNMFNRNTLGVFEPGSTFKILNVAIALDSGSARINSLFDASTPINLGRHTIRDFRGKNRWLSLAEAFVFSSNIAAVKIAQETGTNAQIHYMKKFGVMDKGNLEIPENGAPIIPSKWTEATTMTVSYGYGVSISPIQLITIISSIVNDGFKIYPSLLRGASQISGERLISSETSAIVRELMRAVIRYGTGKKAGVDGIDIIGKTGTSYKVLGKSYGSDANRARITTFVGGFPKDNPKYMLLVMLDNPQPAAGTHGFATAGWNAAVTAHNIFSHVIPILDDGIHHEESDLKVTRYIKLN